MINMSGLGRADAVLKYFKAELSTTSYYTKDAQGSVGRWNGKLANQLGIEGLVSVEDFSKAARNINPANNNKITARTNPRRRVGYDLTFTAPKGVSLALELGGDRRVESAFNQAVARSMKRIEQGSNVRVRVNGKNEERNSGNLLWGEFTHYTARPVDRLPDPHLHKHVIVFNASYDPVEKKIKAVDLAQLKTNMQVYEAEFHADLAKELYALGYEIKANGAYWDLALSESLKNKFSQRGMQVLEEAKKQKRETGRERAKLAIFSRAQKIKDISMSELRDGWNQKLTSSERVEIANLIASAKKQKNVLLSVDQEKLTQMTLDHMFEREAVLKKSGIIQAAVALSPTGARPAHITKILTNHPDLVHKDIGGHSYVTSKSVAEEEAQIIDYVRQSKNSVLPLNPSYERSPTLTDGQNNAIHQLLRSQNSVFAIEGRAGAGKTTLMREAVRQIEKAHWKSKPVVMLAPTAEASRGVLRSEGFTEADTVQRFFIDKDFQRSAKSRVIWVDEAGLLSTSDMKKLFDIAKKQKARIILSGDTRQHSSVNRGEAFATLKRHARLQPVRVDEIMRQQANPKYRNAVQHLADGNVKHGFDVLDELGAIKKPGESYGSLCQSYQEAHEAGKKVLVVSPSRKEGKAVTDALRASLTRSRKLGGKARTYRTLQNLHASDAQKRHIGFYQRGQVLRFHARSSGFVSSDKATVIASGKGWVVAWDKKRFRLALVITASSKVRNSFSVNTQQATELRRGDLIRFTANTYAVDPLPRLKNILDSSRAPARINNGSIHKVRAMFGTQILLDNGFVVDSRTGTFEHGYVATSYASQGQTADKVLIAQSKEHSGASFDRQFYVSASRGRREIEIFTDDKEHLLKSVTKAKTKISSSDILNEEFAHIIEDELHNNNDIYL